ncbi:unnamed protein product [Arabidopsis lyrata]|nr:unnamed protein product [Arabidopsis lyrata]
MSTWMHLKPSFSKALLFFCLELRSTQGLTLFFFFFYGFFAVSLTTASWATSSLHLCRLLLTASFLLC